MKLRPVRGKGWSGRWSNGDLGWLVSEFVQRYNEPLNEIQKKALGRQSGATRGVARGDMYRVEIIIRPLKDRRGRYIKRVAR